MLAERGVTVSHTTIYRWVQQYVPEFDRRWSRYAKPVHSSWRVDGNAASHRALRLLRKENPDLQSVVIRSSRYLNNIVEQDHHAIKRRCAPMLALKSFRTAAVTLAGVELAHPIRPVRRPHIRSTPHTNVMSTYGRRFTTSG
jgi:transposase-like protein